MSSKAKASRGEKPKKNANAYTFFLQACRDEMKKKGGAKVPFGEMSKQCSEQWKSMDEKTKQKFNAMAERDKARYQKEMKSYVPPPGEEEAEEKGKKRKRTKDPNAPKRPLSAYFLYLQENRANLKKEKPDIKPTEVAKELAARWNGESTAVKKKFDDLAKRAKENYEKEMAKYSKRAKTDDKGGKKGKAQAPSSEEDSD